MPGLSRKIGRRRQHLLGLELKFSHGNTIRIILTFKHPPLWEGVLAMHFYGYVFGYAVTFWFLLKLSIAYYKLIKFVNFIVG